MDVLSVVGAFPVPPAGTQTGSIAPGQCFGRGSEAVGMWELTQLQLSAHWAGIQLLGSSTPILALPELGGLFPWVFFR